MKARAENGITEVLFEEHIGDFLFIAEIWHSLWQIQ